MMTPFTAQLVLAVASLRRFLAWSGEEKNEQVPWVSSRVLVRGLSRFLGWKLTR